MATIKSESKPKRTLTRIDRTRFGPSSAGIPISPKEFDAIPAARFKRGYRYEVVNGVLVVSPPVSDAEADPNDDLGHLLRTYQETHPEGKALDRTMPERLVPGTSNRRRCDRAIWAGLGHLPDTGRDVPAIVVEFVSSSRRDVLRDYEQKRDEYLAAGVKEYWIIDRFRRIMTVYREGSAGLTYDLVTEGREYETGLLPGFVLPLSRLLATADDWSRRRRERKNQENKPTPPTGGIDG